MNRPESEIQQLIQIEAAKHGCLLMRNNSGAMKDETGRLVYFGLGNLSKNQKTKSSDLVGITTITITPDMVGRKIGVFTAVEVKKEGWSPKKLNEREEYQFNFIQWVKSRGGFAGFASTVDSIKDIIA